MSLVQCFFLSALVTLLPVGSLGTGLISEDAFEAIFAVPKAENPEEQSRRVEALRSAEERIIAHNLKESSYKEGLNEFSNLPDDEKARDLKGAITYTGTEDVESRSFGSIVPPSDHPDLADRAADHYSYFRKLDRLTRTIPETYDSRDYGIVSPIKNQRNCGSCVSFATNAVLESCIMKANRLAGHSQTSFPDLSEQYFVDCGYDNKTAWGCNGAFPHAYLKTASLAKNGPGKFPHEFSYPYRAYRSTSNCAVKSGEKFDAGAVVTDSHWSYYVMSNRLIKKVIYRHGVILTNMNAEWDGFMNYRSGIFDDCPISNKTDHAIALVGWGKENGVEYWIVKNSWGTTWGENGYARVKIGSCAVGRNGIAVARCESTKKDSSPDVPTTTKSEKTFCDLKELYKKDKLDGFYKLNTDYKGTVFTAHVHCSGNICSLNEKHYEGVKGRLPTACVAICGQDSCPSLTLGGGGIKGFFGNFWKFG